MPVRPKNIAVFGFKLLACILTDWLLCRLAPNKISAAIKISYNNKKQLAAKHWTCLCSRGDNVKTQ